MSVMLPGTAIDLDTRDTITVYVEHNKAFRSITPKPWAKFPLISMHSRAWVRYKGERTVQKTLGPEYLEKLREMCFALRRISSLAGKQRRFRSGSRKYNDVLIPTVILSPVYLQKGTEKVMYRIAWGEITGLWSADDDMGDWRLHLADLSPAMVGEDGAVAVVAKDPAAAFDYAEEKARMGTGSQSVMFRLMMLANLNPPRGWSSIDYLRQHCREVLDSMERYNPMLVMFS